MKLLNKTKALFWGGISQLFFVVTAMADTTDNPIPISQGTKQAFSSEGVTGAILYIFTQDIIPIIQVVLIIGALFYCGLSLFSAIKESLSEKHLGPLKQAGVLVVLIILFVGLIVYLLGLTATAFKPT